MTNKEYIEKNNISFSDAMKMWDNKTSCINDWLNQEYLINKFKIGDILMVDYDILDSHYDFLSTTVKDHIFFVIDCDDNYLYVKEFDHKGNIIPWVSLSSQPGKYGDDSSVKLIKRNTEHILKKIA